MRRTTTVTPGHCKGVVYKPAKADNTGRCVVICPGGGYSHLAMEHEGHNWAPFFNNMGITAVVLKYRMPHGNCEVPIADAEEALKLVRRNAAAWGVKADQVGIMGFSAGGHLASTIATHSKGEARPDFQILFYPVITMMPDITHQAATTTSSARMPRRRMRNCIATTPRCREPHHVPSSCLPTTTGPCYRQTE